MKAGDLVDERFMVEGSAGAGGMGVVFRATDTTTGEAVALKVAAPGQRGDADRFLREAQLLAGLSHPGVVRYVAHGATPAGEAFLAMEWLEGEDLAARLARAPLTTAETLAMGARVAAALAHAHAHGVLHRDVKPSNVLLVGGEPARATVLDLGLARPLLGSRPMTATGAVLGTVGYMAPEQARGEREVDARADVFSLGCVLFECLAGRPAFEGEHVVAVLAKVLMQSAPRLVDARPDLPASLDALLERMLAKEPAARFADAGEVAAALAAVELGAAAPAHAPVAARPALSAEEQRLVSVVLVDLDGAPDPAGSTLRLGARDIAADASLAAIAAAHGASIAPLATGALLVTMQAASGALDGALRAAECALALCKALPDARVALATGRARSSAHGLFGQVIDRAAKLLAEPGSAGAARIDDVTRGLLEARFVVRERNGALELVARREDAAGVRTLLGKPTPCVGRDKELALLAATFAECVDEPVARVALVTAPAGVGKSRLAHEVVSRVRDRATAVLRACGDPVGAGSSLGLARQLVRAAAGLRPGDAAPQHERLAAYLNGRIAEPEANRVREILGELVGAPTATPSARLRAARNDPRLMGDWMRRTFVDWLRAECARGPLLVVLEDLHWGDLPSVGYVGEALGELAGQPLMVLALARPEVHERFPRLWASAGAQEIRLGGLTPSAATRLAREALGRRVAPETVARIVGRAGGNAYFLEELIRRVAERESEQLPETVLAVAEARLERVEPEARRILRAASIFGEVFWRGGVSLLVGGGTPVEAVERWLETLVDRELLVRGSGCRFAGESEYAFRHALTRDAVHATLTQADRERGHRLAGEWLERAGETDALLLAEHFERGAEPARARAFCHRAARLALEANDFAAAIALVDRALALAPTGEEQGRLAFVECQARAWRGEFPRAIDAGLLGMDLLRPDDEVRHQLAGMLLLLCTTAGHDDLVPRLLDALAADPAGGAPGAAKIEAWATAAWIMTLAGRRSLARTFLERLAITDAVRASLEPTARAWIYVARYFDALIGRGDPWDALLQATGTIAEADLAADRRLRAQGLQEAGAARAALGAWAEARRDLEESARLSAEFGAGLIHALSRRFLGVVLASQGDLAAAQTVTAAAAAKLREMGVRSHELSTRAYLADVLFRRGDLAGALAEAQLAADNPVRALRAHGLAVLARTLVALGRAGEALAPAGEAMAILTELGATGLGEGLVPLALAEAQAASGDLDAGRVSIAAARARLLARAARIGDLHYRASFLDAVPENLRTLELARELLGA